MPGRQENMIFERKSSANPLLCPAPPLDAPVAPRVIAGSTTPSRRIHSPSPKLLPVRHMWDRGGGGKATPKPRHRVVKHRYRHIRPLHRAPLLERGEDVVEERELGQGGDGSAAEQGHRWLWMLPPMGKEEETGALKLIVVPMRKKKR
uniref:Uncharacterized protein n=1 Tax=Oryza sativa subsp. japonica TaxID=39947 RepID=Q5VMA6_ORYSJ|nr:hypothetical protein [Oryza sativa Japonica Group]BAD69419.1 hypothetical protein [Oryza sativa Japonica Group]